MPSNSGGCVVSAVLLQPRVWIYVLFLSLFRIQAETPFPEAGYVFAGPVDGMEFAYIPSGSFLMGSPSSECDREDDEGPLHTVSINSFQLMTTEVTQGMWEEAMGSNPSHDYGVGANYPVYYVSWNDCQEFIEKLNYLDPDNTYRLPTESEWEYSCRSGTATRFYWGDSDSENVIGCYCWYSSNSDSSTTPVGTKEPNAWGLYDMNGNVWEWCQDWYYDSYDAAPTDGSARLSSGFLYRVYRGGGWFSLSRNCSSVSRGNFDPEDGRCILGFRLAR